VRAGGVSGAPNTGALRAGDSPAGGGDGAAVTPIDSPRRLVPAGEPSSSRSRPVDDGAGGGA
jgi:hypothetical protein